MTTAEILVSAKKTCPFLMAADTDTKRNALNMMADSLVEQTEAILTANKNDVERAKGVISDVMTDRLLLTSERIQAMAEGIRQVAKLDDPVGSVIKSHTRSDGLIINKVSVPFGVVAIIYESRPNVTADAAALAVMSGNVCVLRCGKEAHDSAKAIVHALKAGLSKAGLPDTAVNLIEDTSREGAREMMTANGLIDLLIPRGGAGLINACVQNATVPCIQTGTGICHIYVEKSADIDMALRIIENAKTSRPSVCNAQEVCLVDKAIAKDFLPKLKKLLTDDRTANGKPPVELRCDSLSYDIIGGTPAGENDFDTEFLDYILAVKLVDDVNEAVAHISAHSTGHSEAIITRDETAEKKFCSMVDSAAVYVNSSTRFTDGGEFGLGCEMGISTQKLHARGPMGLDELNTYKYIISGKGHIR